MYISPPLPQNNKVRRNKDGSILLEITKSTNKGTETSNLTLLGGWGWDVGELIFICHNGKSGDDV